MEYQHTQRGPLAPLVLAFMLVILMVTIMAGDGEAAGPVITGVVMAILVLVTLAFNSLTVTVADDRVTAAFTFGWPRRVIRLDEVVAVRRVRNKWWYGLGIRLGPGGAWIFSVWGLDAVEVETAAGTRFRIGTNDVDRLHAVLTRTTPARTDG